MPSRVPAGVLAGVAATVTMDAALVLASHFAGGAFASDKIGLELIGRWAAGFRRGRWRHADITVEPRLHGELAIGLAVHYLTGIALTEVYFELLRRSGLGPSLAKGTAFGVATAVLPLVVLYPSMGYGCGARRSDDARRLVRIMLLGHTAFGAGIGLGTALPWGRAGAE